ncbi:unnamed protein product [Orchesella dallaii]|uniref:Uncharacterized protein n=1 Tax=Orchesella dallaii TaxID=48710 RepID=A0ABP1S947_9HEXA
MQHPKIQLNLQEGGLQCLLEFVRNGIDYSKVDTDENKWVLKLGVHIDLQKLKNAKCSNAEFAPPGDGSIPVALKQLDASIANTPSLCKELDLLISLQDDAVIEFVGGFVHQDVFLVISLCYGKYKAT